MNVIKKLIITFLMFACIQIGDSQEKVPSSRNSLTEVDQKKQKAELQKLPRLGRSKKELEILWGKHKGTGWASVSNFKNTKREHIKYVNRGWRGLCFIVDKIKFDVGFYKDQAICIVYEGIEGRRLNFDEGEKIAQVLTKSNFGSRPLNTKGSFSMYSTDFKKRYLFQKGGRYAVVDIELLREEYEKPEIESFIDKL